jgi:hypothetical protein
MTNERASMALTMQQTQRRGENPAQDASNNNNRIARPHGHGTGKAQGG